MTLSEKNGKVIRRPKKIIPKILGLLLVVLWRELVNFNGLHSECRGANCVD